MDWSKAKNWIIMALLVTDLVLGGYLLSAKLAAVRAEREAAVNVAAYLENMGAEVECELPSDNRRLPVLFISFSSGEAGPEGSLSYEDVPVIFSGESEGSTPSIDSAGASKGDIRPSAYAAAELAGDMLYGGEATLNGLVIESVDLVYWMYNSGTGTSDTAFPCWRFETSEGSFFVSAYY